MQNTVFARRVRKIFEQHGIKGEDKEIVEWLELLKKDVQSLADCSGTDDSKFERDETLSRIVKRVKHLGIIR